MVSACFTHLKWRADKQAVLRLSSTKRSGGDRGVFGFRSRLEFGASEILERSERSELTDECVAMYHGIGFEFALYT